MFLKKSLLLSFNMMSLCKEKGDCSIGEIKDMFTIQAMNSKKWTPMLKSQDCASLFTSSVFCSANI